MRLLWFNLKTDADDPILGSTSRWIQAVAKQVERIHVITMCAGRIEVPKNVQVYSVGKEKGYSEPRRALEFYRYLVQILRKERIDACFSHMIPIFSILAAPVLRPRKIPIVTWYAHPSLTLTLKVAHHLSNRVVASVATAYPYKHDKLVVVGQGIDTELFAPGEAPPDNSPLILCVGRVSQVKDHPTLLRALRLLKEKSEIPFSAVILGGEARQEDQSYIVRLRRMVDELEIREMVQFQPPVRMWELPHWYRRCTVHVNLSPTGSGDKVAWEAMACGRPCVVANEGFRETLGQYADDLSFQFADPDSLAERLFWLLTLDERQRYNIGVYLREQVMRLHSTAHLGESLMHLLQSLAPS